MIKVSHIGNYDGNVPEATVLVASDADYVKACKLMAEKAPLKAPLEIWVRQKSHYFWLRNFTEQAGIDCTFSEMTPRTILAEKWNVTIPDWLDDEMVTSQNLSDLDITSEHPARFEDTMLGYFIGTVFHAKEIGADNLSEVVATITNPKEPGAFTSYPVLNRCLEEKINEWKSTHQQWVKEVCGDLLNDSENLWKDLTLWSLLSGYPEKLLDYVVSPQRAMFLRTVPVKATEELPPHRIGVEQASTQIEMFFKDIGPSIKSGSDFIEVLECVSGKLAKEFELIVDLLHSNRFEAPRKDVDLVRRRFSACPGISSAMLASLGRFVTPKRPSFPKKDEEWSAEQWISWTVDEYIPYRHWQTQNQHYDTEIEEAVRQFSDWYLKEYETIHQDGEKSLVHVLKQWEDWIKSEDLSLVLLVDCLPLTYWDLLQNALSRAGFHRHAVANRFAPLPSHTEHSKPLLLTGTWKSSESKYKAILEERAQNDWNGKEIIYLPTLKSLSELAPPENPALVLLNFLSCDELLHSDVESKSSTYEEELYRLFARTADSTKELFERWSGKEGQFSVYVLTDHGASRILEQESQSFDSRITAKLFSNERHRFAYVDKAHVESIPENLWKFGYRFSQPFFQEDCVYFIPCGHNTVKTMKRPKGYVHGGATPEEIIVPAAVFKPVKVAWKELAAMFLKLKIDPDSGKAVFYIQRVVPIHIEIQNPNSEEIHILRVVVLTPGADIKGCRTGSIAGVGHGDVEVDCYFNKSALGKEELVLQFTYEIAGEEHIKELKAAAIFKSAVTGGFRLKDLK